MSFSSINFIFIFLPVTFGLYFLIKNKVGRNIVILTASVLFFTWTDPTHLPLLFVSVLINFIFGLIIGLFVEHEENRSARHYMWVAVVINLMILWFYKYLGLSFDVIKNLTSIQMDWKISPLPLGISYFTFSGLSYILDIYHKSEKAERSLLRFAAYIVMFPKIIQGPITRYGQIRHALTASQINYDEFVNGLKRFVIGLAKKILIADSLAIAANSVFLSDLNTIGAGVAWYGVICFSLQIFYDFSGYTDMAIGIGKMLGFTFPENFNHPYTSKNITEFWRRWHMSLTSWFRTYLFIPLEFARKNARFLRQQTNIVLVFALTGLWHGAGLNYLIWGIYFGIILAFESSGFGRTLKRLPAILQHIYTLAVIMFGWILFRLTDMKKWGVFFHSLFGGNGWIGENSLRALNILSYWPIIIIGIIFSTPLLNSLLERWKKRNSVNALIVDFFIVVLFVITLSYLISSGYLPFLYENF